jgi:pantoate--beta-alanine ligase
LSLVGRAKQECDVAVTTIFVNPTQFGPNEDLAKYPRTLEQDLDSLASLGCDYVFVPASDRIYSPTHSTYVLPPRVATRWEGEIRPGHYQGVATIVLKLFQLIPSHVAYFGLKDYQQVRVIQSMVDDLDIPIRIEPCETVREPDGLAMSSRNRYLGPDERQRALGLWNALCAAHALIQSGQRDVATIESAMKSQLEQSPVDRIDYAVVVHPETMDPIERVDESAVAIIAVRVGNTRLIDNRILLPPS